MSEFRPDRAGYLVRTLVKLFGMRSAFAVVLLVQCPLPLLADEKIDYLKQVRPLLKERCYDCHGSDKQESGLRLDKRQEALTGGDSGVAIVPGDVTRGVLLKRVTSEDSEQVMPPKGDRLTKDEVDLLKKWIEEGANWPPVADKD